MNISRLFLKVVQWSRSRMTVYVLLLLWMTVIFSFSTLPGKETASAPTLGYYLERKGAHVFEYAVLMLLSFRYLKLSYVRESFGRVLSLAAAFSLMYAVTDELHQFFVPFRGARMSDVLIDGLGIFLAGLVLFLWEKNKKRP